MDDSNTGSNSVISEIIDQIGLFNCNTDIKICVSTVGYIKTKEDEGEVSKYYKINALNNTEAVLNPQCTSSTVGSLLDSGELCTTTNTISMKETDSDYILRKPSSDQSVFIDYKNDDILLNISNNLIFFDNFYSGIFLFFIIYIFF